MGSTGLALRYDPAALELSRFLYADRWGRPLCANVAYAPTSSSREALLFLALLFGLPESFHSADTLVTCRYPGGFFIDLRPLCAPEPLLSMALECERASIEMDTGNLRRILVTEEGGTYPVVFAEGTGERYLALDRERPEAERLVTDRDLCAAEVWASLAASRSGL